MIDYRHNIGETAIEEAIEALNEANKTEKFVFLFLFPWLRHIAPELTGWNAQVRCNSKLKKMAKSMIDEAKVNFQPEGEPSNFVEAYIKRMHEVSLKIAVCERLDVANGTGWKYIFNGQGP